MAAPDSSFSSVSVLLPFDGGNGSTTFTDKSLTPKAFTAVGSAQISTAQSRFGSGSLLLSNAYISSPYNAAFAFGSGDFCVETWVRPTSAPATVADIVGTNSSSQNGWCLRLRDTLKPIAGLSTNGSDYIGLEGALTIPLNQWSHLALVRYGNTATLYVNGQVSTTAAISASHFDPGAQLTIGTNLAATSWYFNGYLDDMRITKGGARYVSAFTPPSEAHPTNAIAAYAGAGTPLGDAQAHALVFGGTVEVHGAATTPLGAASAIAAISLRMAASGFQSGAWGTPKGYNLQRATGISSTAFGTPVSPYARTAAVEGFITAAVGRPMAFTTTEVQTNRVVTATPINSTVFGTPSMSGLFTGQATGAQGGTFGAALARVTQPVQAFGPVVAFGMPVLALGNHAAGFSVTAFGTPSSARLLAAASTYRATRWGLPKSSRSNTYLAQPAARGARFGRPKGWSLFAYQATPIEPATVFGTADCQQRHRAASLYSGARFGKPLLIRNTAC